MGGVMVKRVMMEITADDMDAESKLDAITAKADELAAKHPELKVKIDTAAAAEKMRVLRRELKGASTVKADVETGEAAAKVGELQAQLIALDDAAGKVRVKVKDEDAELKLLKLKAQLAALSEKVADPHIRVSGVARAEADIAAVRLELDRLGSSQSGGLLSRLGGSIKGLFGLGESAASAAGSAASSGAGGGGGASMLLPALPAIVAGGEALMVEVTGLVSGFAAAGAGAGSFALLAMPAFKQVSSAYQQIGADQQAYDRALTKSARSSALKHLQQDLAGLDPTERRAVKGIQSLSGEWHKISKAFEPEAFKVFNSGLQLAGKLLPDVVPFAKTFADVLSGLLGQASSFAGSKGFSDWLKQFHKIEGPALTAIGKGFGHLAINLGKIFTVMSSKDDVRAINIAFGILNHTVGALPAAVKRLMDNWDGMSVAAKHAAYDIRRWSHDTAQAFDRARHHVAVTGHDTAVWFDRMRHWAAAFGHGVAVTFDGVRGTLHRWYSDTVNTGSRVEHWFTALPGRILHALGHLGAALWNAGNHAISMLISGLKSIPVVGTMASIAQTIVDHLPHSPAKTGPLSGAGSPDIAGKKIGLMVAAGMRTSIPEVSHASAGVAQAVTVGTAWSGRYGAHGGHGGRPAAPQRIQLEWTGSSADQALITLLRKHIRVNGGNAGILGST